MLPRLDPEVRYCIAIDGRRWLHLGVWSNIRSAEWAANEFVRERPWIERDRLSLQPVFVSAEAKP